METNRWIDGLVPGTYADAFVNHRECKGPFTVVFTTYKPDARPVPHEEVRECERIRGDSNVQIPAEFGTPVRVNVPANGNEVPVFVYTNEERRISHLVVEDVNAKNYEEARELALVPATYILNSVSFGYDVPVEVFQIDVIDQNTDGRCITIKMPYGYGVVTEQIGTPPEMREHAALYREGLNTPNDLYAFLCFYKLIELVEKQNQADAKAIVDGGDKPSREPMSPPLDDAELVAWLQPIFPPWYEWNTNTAATMVPKEAREAKYRTVQDGHLRKLRDRISHGLLRDAGPINIDDPSLRKGIRYWLPYVRMVARRVLLERYYPHHPLGSDGGSVERELLEK